MHLKWSKGSFLVLSAALLLVAPAGSAYANCPNGLTIAHSDADRFQGCGPQPSAFAWAHGRAAQGIINAENIGGGNTFGGHDSGVRQTVGDLLFIQANDDLGNPIPGDWTGNTDFNATGFDGCALGTAPDQFLDNPTCSCPTPCVPGASDFSVLDYVISGVDPAFPNIAKAAAVSVDFNQGLQGWFLDNAGAPNIDSDACGGNAFSSHGAPLPCTAIPAPGLSNGTSVPGGANITFSVGSTAGVPILDDCAIAQSAAQNCTGPAGNPRNFYQGRVLMFRHGACSNTATVGVDRRAWVYGPAPATGTLTVAANWAIFSLEDADLDGILDAGEDGVGGTANGKLDPFIIAGTNAAQATAKVPAVVGANDCVFFATALGFDDNAKSINPPTNTIFGTLVVTPNVSVNPNPVRAGSATPVTDLVTTIRVSKSQGKGTVDWETGVEMTTAGFNVIGTKKGGQETKLNGTLIAAKEGTTGKGASYSVTFDGGQLKGSTTVYVEIVKTDGSKERFGPASF